jgi:hypothetical protein
MNKKFFFLISLVMLLSCNNSNNKLKVENFPTLDVTVGLNNLTKMNLTDFKSNIRYVQLETNANCLITNKIKGIYLEENKIFIGDSDPFLKVFDANTGKYLYNIGSRGQGPGELPYLRHIDMNVKEKSIILGWAKNYKYDFEGNYIKHIIPPELPPSDSTDIISDVVVMLNENLFSVGLYTPVHDHQINAVIIFDEQSNIINSLKSYDDYIQHPTIKTFSYYDQLGFYYRHKERINFFRGLCDTVYAFNPSSLNYEPQYCFSYGKHRKSRYYSNEATINKDEISVTTLSESDNSIFIDFKTIRASTEPYIETIERMMGVAGNESRQIIERLNHSIYAVYDKQKNTFNFLLQPIKGIKGLVNDIDNGIPFWPKYISSNNEFVDYFQSFDFIEYAEKTPNADDSFKKLLKEVNEDDNPIIIIAY